MIVSGWIVVIIRLVVNVGKLIGDLVDVVYVSLSVEVGF